ncbi:MAG: hypothetical protein ACLFSM_00760 [Thermoplasmata archaeon]
MKTKLYSELKKLKVDTPTEGNAGKIVDILGQRSKKYWDAREVEIKSGTIKKKKNYFQVSDLTYVDEKRISLGRGIDHGNDSHSRDIDISLSTTEGKNLMNSDEEKVGTIYDYEIQIDSQPWKVWNILVKPTGMSPTKRRMRISIDDIEEVAPDKVVLVESYVEPE